MRRTGLGLESTFRVERCKMCSRVRVFSIPNWEGYRAYDGDSLTPEVLEIVSGGFERNSL